MKNTKQKNIISCKLRANNKIKHILDFISPVFVDLPRKTKKDKRVYLNLNVYRNLHYIVSNQAKKVYLDQMRGQMEGLVFESPIEISFILYKKSARRTDRANILSIVEKFFCDSLVECGCLPDDNDEYIQATHYYSGGIDRENPRVEICISL